MCGSITNRTPKDLQSLGQRLPLLPGEHDTEVRHGHVVTVDRIGMRVLLGRGLRMLVNDQLMAEEVEVHPLRAGAPFRQAEHVAVRRRAAGRS